MRRIVLDPNLARRAIEEGREIVIEYSDKHFRASVGGKSKYVHPTTALGVGE